MPTVAADKKKKDVEKPASNALDSNLLAPGSFTGTLLSIPSAGGSFTVDVQYKYLEATKSGGGGNGAMAGLYSAQQRIAQLQMQVMAARSPWQAMQAMQQLRNAMGQMQAALIRAQQASLPVSNFRVVTGRKTVEFHAAEDVAVRNLYLPAEYDDKGQLKKMTTEEVKKLKGNPRLPGFEGKMDDLKTGSTVVIVMSRTMPAKPVNKDKDKDPEAAEMEKKNRNQVKMVLIAGEDMSANTMSASGKKGKK